MAAADSGITEQILAVDEDDAVAIATTQYEWTSPMDVVNVDQVEWDGAAGDGWTSHEVVLESPYGTEYRVEYNTDDGRVYLRTQNGTSRGRLKRLERVDPEADEEGSEDGEVPTVQEAWAEACRRASISHHVDFEDVLEAADGAQSLFEASREARIGRKQLSTAVSALGLVEGKGQSRTFPPRNIDERLEMVRNGELPDDANARDWDDWGEDDE